MIARRDDFAVFLVVAFGLSWLFSAYGWFVDKSEKALWMNGTAVWMMLTPALGVLAVWRYRRMSAAQLVEMAGLGLGDRPRRTGRLILAAWLGTAAFVWAALGLGVLLGIHTVDYTFGASLAVLIVIEALVSTVVSTLPLALGEEMGWRGWLQPQLTGRLGTPIGLVLTGVIWGLWHAPLTLRGYNYPELGAWAAVVFIPFCVLFGSVLGWLRMKSGSVWPCVVAHAALNASGAGVSPFSSFEDKPNRLLDGHGGLVGWILLAVIATILFVAFPVRSAGRSAPAPHTDDTATAAVSPAGD